MILFVFKTNKFNHKSILYKPCIGYILSQLFPEDKKIVKVSSSSSFFENSSFDKKC